jgi:hypothetical protein
LTLSDHALPLASVFDAIDSGAIFLADLELLKTQQRELSAHSTRYPD